MSIFKETKDAMMLVITILVLTLITGFFYLVLGGYRLSEIDVSDKEVELVALRTLKCLKNNELRECIKTDKYGIKVHFKDKVLHVNKETYDRLLSELKGILLFSYPKNLKQFWGTEHEADFYVQYWLTDPISYLSEDHYNKTRVYVMFKK